MTASSDQPGRSIWRSRGSSSSVIAQTHLYRPARRPARAAAAPLLPRRGNHLPDQQVAAGASAGGHTENVDPATAAGKKPAAIYFAHGIKNTAAVSLSTSAMPTQEPDCGGSHKRLCVSGAGAGHQTTCCGTRRSFAVLVAANQAKPLRFSRPRPAACCTPAYNNEGKKSWLPRTLTGAPADSAPGAVNNSSSDASVVTIHLYRCPAFGTRKCYGFIHQKSPYGTFRRRAAHLSGLQIPR